MTTSSNKAQRLDHDIAHGSVVLLTSITGRTPLAPENASAPVGIRFRPTEEQVRSAPGMSRELSSTESYRDDFGKRAPDAAAVSAALSRARALSDESARAEQWAAWLKAESQIAWQQALELTNKLKDHYELADRADPSIAQRYPETSAFYDARAKSAERAVASRKRNRAAKAKNP